MRKQFFLCLITFLTVFRIVAQPLPSWKITDVQQLITADSSGVVVLNCWATFCKPCIAEIPHFIEVVDRYANKGVSLYLISLDLPAQYPTKIQAFIKKKQFTAARHAWLNETDADYFCPKIDAAWSGSIPATLIINRKSGYRVFFESELSAEELETEIKKALNILIKKEQAE